MKGASPNTELARNLRLLCSYYKSIAEVCRRLDINRAQFNRYLNGQHRPSGNTLRRLCEFFGVEVHEILLPHEQFTRLVQARPQQTPQTGDETITSHLRQLSRASNRALERYLGYYFEYYLSMSAPGRLLCNLVCLERRRDQVVYQRTERMQAARGEPICHNRYQGVAYLLTDRLFLVDHETINQQEISQTILFPTYRNRVSRLTGLKMGVSDNSERMPCCARVLYEYLGRRVNLRRSLSKCGLYERSCKDISPGIWEAVDNRMDAGEYHFRARH